MSKKLLFKIPEIYFEYFLERAAETDFVKVLKKWTGLWCYNESKV